MEKDYVSLSFWEYPPIELLEEKVYTDSYKRLSFQFRTKKDDKLLAYASIAKGPSSVEIPNVDTAKGCHILDINTNPIRYENFQITDLQILNALLGEIEFEVHI